MLFITLLFCMYCIIPCLKKVFWIIALFIVTVVPRFPKKRHQVKLSIQTSKTRYWCICKFQFQIFCPKSKAHVHVLRYLDFYASKSGFFVWKTKPIWYPYFLIQILRHLNIRAFRYRNIKFHDLICRTPETGVILYTCFNPFKWCRNLNEQVIQMTNN